jgi:hypothetical protein
MFPILPLLVAWRLTNIALWPKSLHGYRELPLLHFYPAYEKLIEI